MKQLKRRITALENAQPKCGANDRSTAFLQSLSTEELLLLESEMIAHEANRMGDFPMLERYRVFMENKPT